MNIQKKVEVYLDKKRNTRQIDVVQYSTGIQLVFVLMDFIAPEGTTATLYVQKPSGHIVYQEDNITVSSGTVTVDLENQAIVECGKVIYQLTLVNGEDEIITFASIMNVEKNYADSNAVESTTVISAFKKVTEEQIAKIQAKAEETLATIPDDYTDIYNATVELSQIKAPVIVQKASGNPILLTDSASSKVFDFKAYGKSKQKQYSGKNLLPNTATSQTVNGVKFTVNEDKSVTASGTATANTYLWIGTIVTQANTYICSIGFMGNANVTSSIYLNDTWKGFNGQGGIEEFSVDCSENDVLKFGLYVGANQTINTTFYPMIRKASITDSTYEPYVGGVASPNPDYPQEIVSVGDSGTLEVKSCGKNLLQNTHKATTLNGISSVLNADGSITFNGLSTGDAFFSVGKYNFKVGKTYIMNGCPSGGNFSNAYSLYTNIDGAYKSDIGTGVTITPQSNSEINITILFRKGISVNNLTFYPMIRLAEVEDDTYEPYKSNKVLIPLTEPLRSVGDVKDEIVKQNGVWGVLRRIACKQLTTVFKNQGSNSNNYGYYQRFGDVGGTTVLSDKLSYKPMTTVLADGATMDTLGVSATPLYGGVVYFNVGYYLTDNTVEGVTAWLADNPITVEYELATEIFEPFEDQTQFNQLSVFNPIAYIIATDEADMDLEYAVDTKTYIDNKFAELSAVLLNN